MKKKILFTTLSVALLFSLLSLTACSDDETPTVGVLRVEFTSWKQEWTNHLSIAVTPIDQEDKIIKQVDMGLEHAKEITLNPGNYHIYIVAAVDKNPLNRHEYVQIQAGATEIIKISPAD